MRWWNTYQMIRVPENESDECNGRFVRELKDVYENEEGFASYTHTLTSIDWCKMWEQERKEWEKMK
jgi:hypothetical protein